MIKKLVLGLAGMPGAGKSVVVQVAKQNGYEVSTMGDIVRDETKRRGLQLTAENIGKIMLELRQKEGSAVISKKCIPKIKKAIQNKIIIDGIRSLDEVEEFKKNYPKFTLIAVHSSPETRFRRLYSRRRSDDPKNSKIFRERDMRELKVGLGNVITMAEYMIINEEDLKSLKEKTEEILEEVEKKWKTQEYR